MQSPIQIRFRDMEPSPALEEHIRDWASKLEEYSSQITHCRVVVEAPHKHHQQGRLFHCLVDVAVPGRHVVAGRNPDEHASHEDAYVAIRDAFRAARRSLEEHVRRRRDSHQFRTGDA